MSVLSTTITDASSQVLLLQDYAEPSSSSVPSSICYKPYHHPSPLLEALLSLSTIRLTSKRTSAGTFWSLPMTPSSTLLNDSVNVNANANGPTLEVTRLRSPLRKRRPRRKSSSTTTTTCSSTLESQNSSPNNKSLASMRRRLLFGLGKQQSDTPRSNYYYYKHLERERVDKTTTFGHNYKSKVKEAQSSSSSSKISNNRRHPLAPTVVARSPSRLFRQPEQTNSATKNDAASVQQEQVPVSFMKKCASCSPNLDDNRNDNSSKADEQQEDYQNTNESNNAMNITKPETETPVVSMPLIHPRHNHHHDQEVLPLKEVDCHPPAFLHVSSTLSNISDSLELVEQHQQLHWHQQQQQQGDIPVDVYLAPEMSSIKNDDDDHQDDLGPTNKERFWMSMEIMEQDISKSSSSSPTGTVSHSNSLVSCFRNKRAVTKDRRVSFAGGLDSKMPLFTIKQLTMESDYRDEQDQPGGGSGGDQEEKNETVADDASSRNSDDDGDDSVDLMDQLSYRTKVQCNLLLTRLCYSHCNHIEQKFIDETLTRLEELYEAPVTKKDEEEEVDDERKRTRHSKSQKTTTKSESDVETYLLSASSSSFVGDPNPTAHAPRDTLRGLESELCFHALDALLERHVHNILRTQQEFWKRRHEQRQQDKSSSYTTTGSPMPPPPMTPQQQQHLQEDMDQLAAKLRRASIKTSRPLRHMAIQLAKYDAKQSIKAIFTKNTTGCMH